jgi:hypothetical protein
VVLVATATGTEGSLAAALGDSIRKALEKAKWANDKVEAHTDNKDTTKLV